MAGLFALLIACGGDPIPPVPENLRRMTEREATCLACHARGTAPSLSPGETGLPASHPSVDPEVVRRVLEDD